MEEANPRDFVPEKYKFAHEYCFFLHDILAEIVIFGEQEKIFHHSFGIRSVEDAEQIQKRSGEDLAEWMENNGYVSEFREANRRHIFLALLSDFCQFVYEALSCSRKGKLTVTYALLRKPLKENLFYFEWLLADSSDFIERFHAPFAGGKRPLPLPVDLSPQKRIEIIEESIKKSYYKNWVSPNFLYEIRYDKKVDFGFEALFQRATHLITTMTAKTEDQNFNFIFSGEKEKETQWQGLYTILPLILLHTVFVAKAFVDEFRGEKLQDLDFLIMRALLGFSMYMKSQKWDIDFDLTLNDLASEFSSLNHQCLSCHKSIEVDFECLKRMYEEGVLVCKQCGYKIILTSKKELLIAGHLMQQKVFCPNCKSIVEPNKENLDNVLLNKKVICQECKEEIELLDFLLDNHLTPS
jgi:hypothetical protein